MARAAFVRLTIYRIVQRISIENHGSHPGEGNLPNEATSERA